MPQIIRPGNPDAQFPLGHAFVCKNCSCKFRLLPTDAFTTIGFEGSHQIIKMVLVTCPFCLADVSEKRTYAAVESEIRSEDGQTAVGVGYQTQPGLSAFINAPASDLFASRPLSELNPNGVSER